MLVFIYEKKTFEKCKTCFWKTIYPAWLFYAFLCELQDAFLFLNVPSSGCREDYLSFAGLIFATSLCSPCFLLCSVSLPFGWPLHQLWARSERPTCSHPQPPVTGLASGKFCECWHQECKSMHVFIEFWQIPSSLPAFWVALQTASIIFNPSFLVQAEAGAALWSSAEVCG